MAREIGQMTRAPEIFFFFFFFFKKKKKKFFFFFFFFLKKKNRKSPSPCSCAGQCSDIRSRSCIPGPSGALTVDHLPLFMVPRLGVAATTHYCPTDVHAVAGAEPMREEAELLVGLRLGWPARPGTGSRPAPRASLLPWSACVAPSALRATRKWRQPDRNPGPARTPQAHEHPAHVGVIEAGAAEAVLQEEGVEGAVGVGGKTQLLHSITSSARIKIDCGMVRPRAFAVFRLITNSNLVGRSTGRSPGLAPFRILSTQLAERRNPSRGPPRMTSETQHPRGPCPRISLVVAASPRGLRDPCPMRMDHPVRHDEKGVGPLSWSSPRPPPRSPRARAPPESGA